MPAESDHRSETRMPPALTVSWFPSSPLFFHVMRFILSRFVKLLMASNTGLEMVTHKWREKRISFRTGCPDWLLIGRRCMHVAGFVFDQNYFSGMSQDKAKPHRFYRLLSQKVITFALSQCQVFFFSSSSKAENRSYITLQIGSCKSPRHHPFSLSWHIIK